MNDSEGCLDCGRGLCELCQEHECCKPATKEDSGREQETKLPASGGHVNPDKNVGGRKSSSTNSVGRPIKEPGDVQDRKSTGRKRAALLYPIVSDKPCEWRRLSNCGGGKYPIIGCYNGVQQHRHHGPDKDTLNNAPGNVHRICYDCHNIWHSQNDKGYDTLQEYPKHDPRPATEDELIDRMSKIRYVVQQ